jgi:hypothetical protein
MDAESLIAAEHARREAMARNDAEALGAMLADRFHYAHINGLVDDRDQYLARISSGKVNMPYTSAREMKVDLREGYALLTGISIIGFEWVDGSARGEVETLFTSVWESHPEGWRLAAYASTPMG